MPKSERIQQIIDESKQANINPAILIAFWGAEQSFGNENWAFGYDCPKGGCSPRSKGFEKQLAGTIKVINDAIENRGNYTTPQGENIWTRLLYNYVAAARRKSYNKYGYVSDISESRISYLRKLVPDQVICAAAEISVQVGQLPCLPQAKSRHCGRASAAMIVGWATGKTNATDDQSPGSIFENGNPGLLTLLNNHTGKYRGKWSSGLDFHTAKGKRTVIQSLQKGHPVLLYNGKSSTKTHIIVLAGYDSGKDSFTIYDPFNRQSPYQKCSIYQAGYEEIINWGPYRNKGYSYLYIRE